MTERKNKPLGIGWSGKDGTEWVLWRITAKVRVGGVRKRERSVFGWQTCHLAGPQGSSREVMYFQDGKVSVPDCGVWSLSSKQLVSHMASWAKTGQEEGTWKGREREAASPSLPVSSVSTRVREVVSSFQQSYKDHLWWKVWTYWSHGARPENRRCHRAWEVVPTARHLHTCTTHSWERLAQLQGPEWTKPQPQNETSFFFAHKSTYTSSLALLSVICSSWQWSWLKTGSVNHIQCFSQHCIGVGCLSHMA